MLGPIDKEMGGDADLTGSDNITIQNNVNGNMLIEQKVYGDKHVFL